ncbi:MAG: tyrosine recombinase XerC [Puniceicoccales bacterium]|jgi:integrase/recombinase XerC|nr:tyrosine recombinase XerC [Puniceicoccales bacterium]
MTPLGKPGQPIADCSFPGASSVSHFILSLSSERRMASYTIRNYGQALRDFCLWAQKESGFDGDFSRLSRRLMRDFIVEKQHTHARTTLHNHLAALRSFYRYLLRKGIVESSPLTGLRSPKLLHKLPRFLTEQQTLKLLKAPAKLQAAEHISEWTRIRDEALLECLYGAGLRVSELCGMDYDNVNFTNGLIRVLGKGNKERIVPIGAVALAAIVKLRNVTPRCLHTNAPVFTTDESAAHRLYPRAVQLLLKRYLDAAGLPQDLTPHKLRHTCATHMLNHEADLRIIQEQLGHASLSTTQIYTHVSLARLKSVHARAHPRA